MAHPLPRERVTWGHAGVVAVLANTVPFMLLAYAAVTLGELRRALPGARGPGCHSACVKLSGLLHRTRSELPGVSGVARVDRHTGALLRRLRPGDIAVLDQVDLDRATADALVAAEVGAVVNAAPSISGDAEDRRRWRESLGGAAGQRLARWPLR